MSSQIPLHSGMGKDVIRHLSQFGTLPAKGILAGQAVDSALTDLYGMGGGVYNDLDIFRQSPGDSAQRVSRANHTAFRCDVDWRASSALRESGENLGYGSMAAVIEVIDTYGIASVTRDGLLNYVNCFMASGRLGTKLTAQRVISGFDLNCTRVAVDLETGLLHWDRHYEAFRHSRQLRISMMHTPWHTFLRLLKKSQELPGVYVNLEQAAQACTSVVHSPYLKSLAKDRNISLLFGDKHREMAFAHATALEPYFDLEPVFFQKKDGALRRTRDSSGWEGVSAQSAGPGHLQLWQMTPRSEVATPVQTKVNQLGAGCLFFAGHVVEEAQRVKRNSVYVKLDALIADRQAQLEKEKKDMPWRNHRDFVQWCAQAFGTAYVEGQALPSVGSKVASFVAKHTGFREALIGLTLAQQAACIQRIKDCARKFADSKGEDDAEQYLGVLENEACPTDYEREESLMQVLERAWKRDSEPFTVEPLPLPPMPPMWSHFEVKELLSTQDLKVEGYEQHHCVGGYSGAIRSGRSRILRIRIPKQRSFWSTAELRIQREGGRVVYRVAQHRAQSNKAVKEVNDQVLEHVLTFLNMEPAVQAKFKRGTLSSWASLKLRASEALLNSLGKTSARLKTALRKVEERLVAAAKDRDTAIAAETFAARYRNAQVPTPEAAVDVQNEPEAALQ